MTTSWITLWGYSWRRGFTLELSYETSRMPVFHKEITSLITFSVTWSNKSFATRSIDKLRGLKQWTVSYLSWIRSNSARSPGLTFVKLQSLTFLGIFGSIIPITPSIVVLGLEIYQYSVFTLHTPGVSAVEYELPNKQVSKCNRMKYWTLHTNQNPCKTL